MTIYNFIRYRIEDGSLVLQPGSKKSRKVLTLSSTLEASLHRFLAERYIHSADCGSVAVGTTDRDITIDTVPIASIGYHGMSARRTA